VSENALTSLVNRGNVNHFGANPPLESHARAYTCFPLYDPLYDTFATKGNYRDWPEIRKGVKGMHVSIRRYGLLTREPVEKVLQGVREGFIPIIRDQPGFLAYYALDSGGGTLTSISIFEHRAGAEKSNKMAVDWVGKNLINTLPTSPEIIVGEVGAHELNLYKLGIR
jgi:hypothetical protein